MSEHVEVRRGAYHDSVTLMAVSRDAGRLDGVQAALVAMATDLNLAALAPLGFDPDVAGGAGPDDLVIALRAEDDAALDAARAAVEGGLAGPAGGGAAAAGEAPPPRTVAAAARRTRAGLALLSVPGPHVFGEALDALYAGLSVMIFSDNVPVDQEVALKAEAGRRGLLVMGPDCGTAIVGGVGLGFANVVAPGPVGLVAASGTGAQQLTCLLDDAGVGVSAVLGVGGRDLSEAVGAASTLAALAALDADPATELVVVVSKPPAPAVAERVAAPAAAAAPPVLLAFVGPGRPDLTAVANDVLARLGRPPLATTAVTGDRWVPGTLRWWPAAQERGPHRGALRGLFAGGTLCQEALAIAGEALGPLPSNVAFPGWPGLPADGGTDGDALVDFGDDRLTRGRPHPMIDQRSRLAAIAAAGERGGDDVVLLDVVLGHGAHPDPASELAPALEQARGKAAADGRDLAVVVSLVGTAGDPQDRERQAAALAAAGASVHLSNAEAARKAVDLLARDT